MNRKTYLLLAVLILLGLGTWWLSRRSEHAGTTLDADATAFAVADTAAVDKIFVSSKGGQNHTLRRVARNYWRLDDRYDVRPDMIKMLLETLKRTRVKAPVPRAARNNIVRSLAASSLKVEVYEHGQLSKTFYVGRPTEDQEGTYMILQGAEEPYVTHIPGFVGFLNTRFNLTPRNWRTVSIFNTPLPLLESVEVVAMGLPDGTFTVRAADKGFVVEGQPVEKTDTLAVRYYARLFGNVTGQDFLDSVQIKQLDSLLHTPPQFVVTVRGRKVAKPERLRLWRAKGNEENMVGITDRDPNEVMVVQNFVLKNVLLSRANFAKGRNWRPEY